MQSRNRNRTAWPQGSLERARPGSTVVAFERVSHRSRFRNAAPAAIHSPAVGAEVIGFQPRPVARAAQSRAGHQAMPAAINPQHSMDRDTDYSHRILINLLASVWLAILGTAGYFTLSGLVQMP